MDEKSLKPQLRFKEFTDAWEQRKLGDFGSVCMNKRIFKNQTSENDEIPFYKIGTFGGKADAFISRSLFEEYKSKYPYPVCGDILISASGSIGRTVEYQGAEEYFQDSNIVWLNHRNTIHNPFLKYFYAVVKWNGIEGSTIKRLYNENILNTQITLPQKPEQQKIGTFFSNLDNLITLHQRKLDKLSNVKKALLEKMFPKNDSDVPEIRFKGFTDAWEQRKFQDMFSFERPDPYIVKSDKYSNEYTMPVLTANKAFVLGYTKENSPCKKTSLIFDDFTLECKYVDFPYMVKSSAIKILTVKDEKKDNLRFSFERLNTTKIEILGHARHYISVVQPTKTRTPNILEQNKISELFSNLDNLITLHQRKLEKLKNIKKACLEKMFV